MKRALGFVALAVAVSACSGGVPLALPSPSSSASASSSAPMSPPATPAATSGAIADSPSPTTAPTPSPVPAASAYGVLVDLLSSPTLYMANVVGEDGLPWASLRLDKRTPIATASGHAIELPYVSTSLSSLYALYGNSEVLSLHLGDGKQAVPIQLPVEQGMEAAFAVSPDDRLIAYTVLDFNRSPVHVTLYTDSLHGGNRKVIFESDSDYVWPVAWHGGLIVLAHAYGPYEESITKAAPGRDNPYSAISYHLVDPVTARRVVLMGACTVSGPLSPAGSACIQGGTIDWQGNVTSWGTNNWGSVSSAASLSPQGDFVAAAMPAYPYNVGLWEPGDKVLAYDIIGPGPRDWSGWLDSTHLLVAGGASRLGFQMRVITVPAPGQSTPTVMGTMAGFYAGRLPTDIV